MIATPRKLRPIVKTHGGKAYLARRIIGHLPEHKVYVEPFAGGLSVLLNKPRAEVEVVADLNADLITLYLALRDRPGELIARLKPLTYSQETFDRAVVGEPADDLDRAVLFLVTNRMSRGGLGKTFAWSERLRGGQPGDKNGWETILAQLPAVAERLAGVEIRRARALDVIREHDGPDTLHCCDPPYMPTTRTARRIYGHEMSVDDHADLLDVLVECRGTIVLCGYANPLYDTRLVDWQRVEFSMPNHSGQGKQKQRRIEVLWVKPGLWLPLRPKQLSLSFT
jgi:DNA adenine methylase